MLDWLLMKSTLSTPRFTSPDPFSSTRLAKWFCYEQSSNFSFQLLNTWATDYLFVPFDFPGPREKNKTHGATPGKWNKSLSQRHNGWSLLSCFGGSMTFSSWGKENLIHEVKYWPGQGLLTDIPSFLTSQILLWYLKKSWTELNCGTLLCMRYSQLAQWSLW